MNLNPFTHGRRKITFISAAFLAIVGGFALCGKFPGLGAYYGTFTFAIAGWLGIALGGHLADQKLLDKNTPPLQPGGKP